ncbi:cytochrome P450 [Salipiger aestuarii]|uniref:cytochrome P450 n=1 Tax=Salipiger aestuarii TaxID=568098 RepID=UPI001238A3F3|nr:cytochrome P450 [Salipiger aestuarii]KAA8607960.1 cytochrome hydroxylase [Salipiger aestuarii]
MTPAALPADKAFDSTLALLREGYRFIPERCARLGSDAFRARIMGRKVICMTGPRGIRLLYGAGGLTRQGALPPTVLRLLQDNGSVQQMEGAAHRHRKALFMTLLIQEGAAEQLASDFARTWAQDLLAQGETCVLDSASDTLAGVVCAWAGFGPQISQDPRLRKTLYEMSARTGSVGPGVIAALMRRRGVKRRLAAALADVPSGSPARRIAAFREDGAPLPPEVAVVEILNLLRPVVAVGRWIAYAARILALEPDWLRALATADTAIAAQFCEEVRRVSPFFPMTGAITTKPLCHEGLDLPRGQWVLADLWGTLHDKNAFPLPEQFHPGRQLSWRNPGACFVPHGGGDTATTHRCPGEKVTVALMVSAMQVLCRAVTWDVPVQDLGVALDRIPAAPASGVRLIHLRARGDGA